MASLGRLTLTEEKTMRQVPFEDRYHVQIFDESGAKLDINNLTREELDEFHANHETDDLNYAVTRGKVRPTRVVRHA